MFVSIFNCWQSVGLLFFFLPSIQATVGQVWTMLQVKFVYLKAAQSSLWQLVLLGGFNDKGKGNGQGFSMALDDTQNTLGQGGSRDDDIHLINSLFVLIGLLKVVLEWNHLPCLRVHIF